MARLVFAALLSAALAATVFPKSDLAANDLCARGRPSCCQTDILSGIASVGCKRPTEAPQTASDFADSCSELGLVASCCSFGIAGIALGCKAIKVPPCTQTLGFGYSIYENPFVRVGYGQESSYDSFDPSAFTSDSAYFISGKDNFEGGETILAGPTREPTTLYNTPNVTLHQKTVSGMMYVYSPVSQNMTLLFRAYDAAYLYIGDAAISGYSRDNWEIYSKNGDTENDQNPDGFHAIPLKADSYTPIRYIVGFSSGSDKFGATFIFWLKDVEDGTQFYSSVCEKGVKKFTEMRKP